MRLISKIIGNQEKPVSNSGNDRKANKTDLTSIIATGSTNTTGAQIPRGAYFYLNGVFCRAIADIATSATFTQNTNYVETTAGDAIKVEDVSSLVVMSDSTLQQYVKAFKIGGFVSIHLRTGKVTSTGSGSLNSIATVDTSLRPRADIVAGSLQIAADNDFGYGVIGINKSNGNIMLEYSKTTTYTLYASFNYTL